MVNRDKRGQKHTESSEFSPTYRSGCLSLLGLGWASVCVRVAMETVEADEENGGIQISAKFITCITHYRIIIPLNHSGKMDMKSKKKKKHQSVNTFIVLLLYTMLCKMNLVILIHE